MKLKEQALYFTAAVFVFATSGCATIVNDANIPLTVSFSDGSSGQCTFKNKRGVWSSDIPTTNVMIRRSDDALTYDCSTKDGREAEGSIKSEMEGGKMAASVVFWDLGITDAITDKHRTYQGNVVIPVAPITDAGESDVSSSGDGEESAVDPFDYSVGDEENAESSQAEPDAVDPIMMEK
jgi:hypothetical protein